MELYTSNKRKQKRESKRRHYNGGKEGNKRSRNKRDKQKGDADKN